MDYRCSNGVAVITLDDVGRRNILDAETLKALQQSITSAADDGAVTGIIRAEGPAFCAGLDRAIVEEYSRSGRNHADGSSPSAQVMTALRSSTVYWSAELQGPAIGAGAALLLECPMVWAVEQAWLSFPEVTLGIFPAAVIARLAPIVGRRRALELITTGRRATAKDAVAYGLVSTTFTNQDEMRGFSGAHARALAERPTMAALATRWWNE